MNYCDNCPLKGKQVKATGPTDSPLLLIGEAPGHIENMRGYCFCGDSGQELDNYLTMVGMHRSSIRVDNIVKCQPPGKRDPKKDEIKCCSDYLTDYITQYQPRVIGTLGKVATEYFLGPISMEQVHGIPVAQGKDYIIVPLYHPAFGLYKTSFMTQIRQDFEVLAQVVRYELKPRKPVKQKYNYVLARDAGLIKPKSVIAVDTEYAQGSTWCLSFSHTPGTAYVVMRDDKELITTLAGWFSNPNCRMLLHNALYDLPELQLLGIVPTNFTDTMVMAYLLQSEPQGLKALAYRHLNMHMKSYKEMVAPATREKAIAYLTKALTHDWPNPEQIFEWRPDGTAHVKQPQNIGKKIQRILNDMGKKPVDPWDRWHHIEPEDGRAMVETELGIMPEGELCDIPFDDAVNYAAQDADATLQIYPILLERIKALRLTDTLNRDIGMMPMAIDMMENGMLTDKDRFGELSNYFLAKKTDYQKQINKCADTYVNPNSSQQVGKLFKQLGVTNSIPKSTEAKYFEHLREEHPIVDYVYSYREYSKLKSTYADALPKHTDENNRIHTTLRCTRTATGRLASANPNLQNQPVAKEDGRKIRECFISATGCSLVSFDYSQIELRVETHEAKDELLLKIFNEGRDPHAETASWIFGVALSDVDDMKQRYPCKRVGFGVMYGLSPGGLANILSASGIDWSLQDCAKFMHEYFLLYPGIAAFIEEIKSYARRYGMIKDMFGRIRYIPEVQSVHERIREEGLRAALATPAQSGAAGIIKQAMRDVRPWYRGWQKAGYTVAPLLQIHDDLLFEMKDEVMPYVIPTIKHVMENAVTLSIPTPVDAKHGKRWGKLEKYNEAE